MLCLSWFTVADLVRIPGAADRRVRALQQPQQPDEEPGVAGAAQVAAAQRLLLRTAWSVESKVRHSLHATSPRDQSVPKPNA